MKNTDNPFMGACVQRTTDERTPVDVIKDCVRFKEDTVEQEAIEGQIEDDDGLLNDSRNTTLLKANQGEEYFRNESKPEEVPNDESQLPALSQPQVDCVDCGDFLGDTLTSDLQGSVATGQHAYNGCFEMPITSSQLPVAYNSYLRFLQENPKRHNQNPMTANQRESKMITPPSRTYPLCSITYDGQIAPMPRSPGLGNQGFEAVNQITPTKTTLNSRKPLTNQSLHQVSQGCGVGPKEVAVGEAWLSQQPATKKDSRGWQEHEKALVKILMLEVMRENAHARTEKRWKIISKRLNSRYSIDRTWRAVKK